MKKFPAQQKAFTIIELIIVITIMIVLAGSALVSVMSFNQNQGTTDDAKTVLTEMRRVYAKATGVFYPNGCTNLTGYTVTIAKDSTDMSVTANCAVSQTESRAGVLKTSKFRDAVSFTFSVPDGTVTPISPNVYPISITIYSTNNSAATKTLTVSSYGVFQLL